MPEGHLLLQTLRSHDQFNTTIYGHDDRYRGLAGGRHVVMVHPDDLAALGFADGDHRRRRRARGPTARERVARDFRVVVLPDRARVRRRLLPRGQPARAARLDRAVGSNCPTSKSVVVRLVRPPVGITSHDAHGGVNRLRQRPHPPQRGRADPPQLTRLVADKAHHVALTRARP